MRITKSFSFEASHHLPNVPAGHKCARVHGHSYRVQVMVDGPINETMGWVIDFGDVTAAWKQTGAKLDHQDLNDFYPNPTAELIATDLARQLSAIIDGPDDGVDPVRLVAVQVRETATSAATWSLWEDEDML